MHSLLSHQICGTLLQQPWETNAPLHPQLRGVLPWPRRGLTSGRCSRDFFFHNYPSVAGSLNCDARQPVQLRPPPLTSCATLEMFPNFSVPPSPHLLHGASISCKCREAGCENPRRDRARLAQRRVCHYDLYPAEKSGLCREETVPTLSTTYPQSAQQCHAIRSNVC